jgi:cell division protein FtsB
VVVISAGALVLGGLVIGGNGFMRVRAMQREITTLEHELVRLRARSEDLIRTVDRLRNDPQYIEKVAREDLGLVRQGDTVLKFPSQER